MTTRKLLPEVPPHLVALISTLDDAGLEGALADLVQASTARRIRNPLIAIATIDCIRAEQRSRARA